MRNPRSGRAAALCAVAAALYFGAPGVAGAAPLDITGGGTNDVLILDAGAGTYELVSNGVSGGTQSLVGVDSVTFAGGAGNDTLRIINGAGLFAPTGGIDFTGGTGTDGIETTGGSATSGSVAPGVSPDAGVLTHTSGANVQRIDYRGIEAPTLDTVADDAFTIGGTPGEEQIGLGNGAAGADGILRATGDDLLSLDFARKKNVTIEGAGDDDVFTPEVTETATDLETLTVDTGAEPGDSVDLGVISMPSVVVSLTTGGPVRDGNGATTNITAAGVGLRAGTGIGVGDAIELNTPKVEGRSTNGGIDLVDSQAVEVGGVAGALTGLFADESGGVHLVAPAITLTDTDGNETVTAGGDFGDATLQSTVGDVTSTVNRDAVGAQSGAVGITSARDITLGTAGASFDDDVRASGPVTLDAVRDVVLDGFADIQSDTAGVTIDGRNVSVSNATGDSASVRANSTGDVTVTTDPGGTMTVTAQDPNAVSSQGGDVIATADHMVIGTNSGVTADNGVAHVKQRTGGNNIDLGSATDASATALELSAAEVDRLHAAIVRVGAGAGTGNVNVSAALTPSGTQILSLLGGSVTQGPAAGIVETNLRATAFTGDVALGAAAGGNDVATLAGGSETGNFSFTDPNAVTVGTVDGASGLDVAPGQTNLTAGGSITQVPGSPVLASAARLQAGGPIALPDSANDLGNVAGTSVGDIRLVAEGIGTGAALRVTTVGLTSGLTATGGAVSVTNLNNKLFADAPITGAPVTLEADDMDIASGGSVTSAGSDTTLLPRSTGRVLELGRTGDLAGALSLSDAEVDRITADRLFLAPDGRAGNAIFTNGISPAGVPEVHLRTAGLVQDDFVGQDMVTGTFGIESVGGVGVSGTQGALETTVSRIEADTDTGGLAIRNLGAVEIGGVSPDQRGLHVATSGPVTFTNGGPVTLTESGVDPTILAGSAPGDDATLSNTGATSDITDTAPGAAIRAPNGAVSVTAGRDLVLGTAGAGAQDNDVTAARAARLEAGRDVVVGQAANVKSDAESRNSGGDATAVAGRDVTIDGSDASLGAEGLNAGQTTVTTGTGGNFTLDSPRVDGLYSRASHVTVNADRAAIDPGAFIRASAGRITFTPATAGGDVDLGSTGDPVGTLALSSDELDTAFSPLTRVTTTTPAGSQTVSAPVAATHTERLSLNSGSTIDTTGAGAIAVENLVTRSVGATALGGPNDVDNLAGNVSGSGSPYSFTDSDDVTTGAIDEVNDGLSTTDGALTLASGGTMTFGKPANAGSAQLLLDAGDRATQGVTAGTALTGGSTRLEGTGPYELANPSNRTDGVEGSVTRSAEWTGASRTAAAPVGVGALESLDGSLTVHPADDLTVTGATQADPGRVELHTDAADRLLTNSSGITSPDVLLRSDRIALAGGTIDAGTKLATLRSHNPGRPTDVGSATDGAGTLRLSDAELDTVTAGTLSVGDRGAGPLTASAPVEPGSAGELELLSSGGFTRTGSGQLGAPTLSFVDGSATPRTWSVDPAAVGDGTGTPIPYAATDLLTVDAGTGNDAFAFRASPTTAYEVDGKSPTSSPGDSMTYDAEGRPTFPDVLPPDGKIASPGVEPVTFRSIETARVTGSDADSDGLRDASDNCVDTPNPGQEDSDRDGRGDACDTDVDDDGRLNDADNCRTDANPTQSDIDSDGRGDTCDPDMDEDGVANGTDNCATKANSDQADLDGDGRGDACDTDRDGDGVLDGADNCVSEPNADQRDTDGNGVGTACDQVERSRNAAGACENRLRSAPNGGVLTGTLGGDVMFGGRGVDVMRGLAGDDCITGSGADDEIHGDEGSDRLSGEDGYDELYGGAGSDAFLRGGDGNDLLDAGSGNDKLYGGDGNDRMIGGTGSDYLSGGADADRLVGGPGRNKLFGGAGNDTIEAANGVRETVDCGHGRDRAVADRTDKLISCERVTRKRVSRRG